MFFICCVSKNPFLTREIEQLLTRFHRVVCCEQPLRLEEYLNQHLISLLIIDTDFTNKIADIEETIQQTPIPPASMLVLSDKTIPKLPAAAVQLSPQSEPEKLRQTILFLIHKNHPQTIQTNPAEESKTPSGSLIVGSSPFSEYLKEEIHILAGEHYPVLITGETGTGKEIIARELHNKSPRAKGPFIPTNCAAIPNGLFESLFWGTAKGAYTDALPGPGFLEKANGGTLCMDEIGDMDYTNQGKLLRVLEDPVIRRLGSHKKRTINIRYVFASNKDLLQQSEEKLFRKDLYYRINTFIVRTVPLRQRAEDILDLAEFFLSVESASPNPRITKDAADKLLSHPWPGNIRELKSVIRRALVFSNRHSIEARHIRF